VDEQNVTTEVPAELHTFELFYLFVCPVNTSDVVGESLFITVSADGETYSDFGLNFTFVSNVVFDSISPRVGSARGGTVVTIHGDNFEEFSGCQPVNTTDVNGEVYDCLTCIFGNNITSEHIVDADIVNNRTITCRAPSYFDLVFPNETVLVWVSKNAQLFTTNPASNFTYLFIEPSPTESLTPSRTRAPNVPSSSQTPSHSHLRSGTPTRTPTRSQSRTSAPEPSSASLNAPSILFVVCALILTVFLF